MTRTPEPAPGAGPTWYDLLGVDRGAPAAEVRAAWKAAIADLDPTDRRFASLNEAAGVLLDADRRAAYDESLAAVRPVVADPDPAREQRETPQPPQAAGPHGRRGVPTWLVAAAGLLALALVVVTGYAWSRPTEQLVSVAGAGGGGTSEVEQSARAAQRAAEQAAVPVLSYGYRTLDEDQAAARSYLTEDYREQYDQLFEVIRDNAPRTETTVQAEVVRSGIVRSGEDRVQVLLFVNQTRTNAETGDERPTVFKNWATVTMERVEGDWLIDEMTSTPAGG